MNIRHHRPPTVGAPYHLKDPVHSNEIIHDTGDDNGDDNGDDDGVDNRNINRNVSAHADFESLTRTVLENTLNPHRNTVILSRPQSPLRLKPRPLSAQALAQALPQARGARRDVFGTRRLMTSSLAAAAVAPSEYEYESETETVRDIDYYLGDFNSTYDGGGIGIRIGSGSGVGVNGDRVLPMRRTMSPVNYAGRADSGDGVSAATRELFYSTGGSNYSIPSSQIQATPSSRLHSPLYTSHVDIIPLPTSPFDGPTPNMNVWDHSMPLTDTERNRGYTWNEYNSRQLRMDKNRERPMSMDMSMSRGVRRHTLDTDTPQSPAPVSAPVQGSGLLQHPNGNHNRNFSRPREQHGLRPGSSPLMRSALDRGDKQIQTQTQVFATLSTDSHTLSSQALMDPLRVSNILSPSFPSQTKGHQSLYSPPIATTSTTSAGVHRGFSVPGSEAGGGGVVIEGEGEKGIEAMGSTSILGNTAVDPVRAIVDNLIANYVEGYEGLVYEDNDNGGADTHAHSVDDRDYEGLVHVDVRTNDMEEYERYLSSDYSYRHTHPLEIDYSSGHRSAQRPLEPYHAAMSTTSPTSPGTVTPSIPSRDDLVQHIRASKIRTVELLEKFDRLLHVHENESESNAFADQIRNEDHGGGGYLGVSPANAADPNSFANNNDDIADYWFQTGL